MKPWFALAVAMLLSSGCGGDDESTAQPGAGGSSGDAGQPEAALDAGSDASNDSTDATEEGDAGQEALALWRAWEEIQLALRQSPDHLPARADSLVAEKDPSKIFEFVRDQIATYPPQPDGFYAADDAVRWGTKATLRGGAGTPREKADLLVQLYSRAGLEAEVVSGLPDPAKLDGRSVLLRNTERVFAPPIPDEKPAQWAEALGHVSLRQMNAIDPDGSKTSSLYDALLAALPTDATYAFDFTLPRIPLVRVKLQGNWTYANPISPTAAFGETHTLDTPEPIGAASPPPQVRVAIEAARSDAPYDRFTLVEHWFDPEDVVGRRIQVAFPPPVAAATLAQMRPSDLETVVPVLSVIGSDMSADDKERLAVVGNQLSFGGDIFEQTPDGVVVNGEPLAPVETDPAAVLRVQDVRVRANGGAFGRIYLAVGALDSEGLNVPRLGASAFEVKEDGVPVSFSLTRNEAPAPKVVLLYDLSTSIPPEFLGAGAVELGNQVIAPLYAKFPDARVRVGTMNFGAGWVTDGWADSFDAAQDQVEALASAVGSSDIWEALYDAQRESPTVILMVTDGFALDVAKPEYVQSIVSGVPVLSLAVGAVDQDTLDEIAELSGGTTVPVAQVAEATAAALEEIDARAVEDYVLSYQAPAQGPAVREVSVTVNAKAGMDSYEVPSSPAIPKALSGLYLTLGFPGREHTAALAGLNLGYSTAFPTITQAMIDDVKSVLLGRVSIRVEGASPPVSVVLDEWIGDKLALRPLVEALANEDDAAIIAALDQGFNASPSRLPLAQPPLVDAWSEQALTFEVRPRVAAMIQRFKPSGIVQRQLDLFPLSQWATATDDPRDGWERTLRATAGLAIMEAEMFRGTSTFEALDGEALSLFEPHQVANQPGLTSEEYLQWSAVTSQFGTGYLLLAPLKPGPFWAIDTTTGTVIGMLPDGTGSGAEDVCNDYDQSRNILQLLSLLGSLFGQSFGGWIALAQWEVKNVTMATLVIGYGGTAEDISNPAGDMACGLINDAIGEGSSLYGLYDAFAETHNTVNPDGANLPTLCGDDDDPCH